MNKNELIEQLAERMGTTRVESRKHLDAFLDIITETMQEKDNVVLQGFGTICVWQQTERSGRNPKTGAPCMIPSRLSVKFRPGKYLLEALNSRQ
ncbi:HU family DNA-binding protein [Parabacteroides sp.]